MYCKLSKYAMFDITSYSQKLGHFFIKYKRAHNLTFKSFALFLQPFCWAVSKIQWNSRWWKSWASLTCDGFNCFTGDRLADKIILNEAGGLRGDLHWMLRPLSPSIDHLCFRIGICGQTAKPHQCESLTVSWCIGWNLCVCVYSYILYMDF